jgi:hypothetical protein
MSDTWYFPETSIVCKWCGKRMEEDKDNPFPGFGVRSEFPSDWRCEFCGKWNRTFLNVSFGTLKLKK